SRPSPAGLTPRVHPFRSYSERAEGMDCRLEVIEPGNDGRGAPPKSALLSQPWPTSAVDLGSHNCRSRVYPRSHNCRSRVHPRSTSSPLFDTPSPYMMSNSTCLNGGASLFLTTLTRVWLPTTSSRSLIAPILRMSRRTEA